MKSALTATIFAGLTLLGFTSVLCAASPVIPTFQDVTGLGNTVVTDKWTNFSQENHPGYPTLSSGQTWPASLGPDMASGRQSLFRKPTGADTDTTDFLSAAQFGGGIYSSDSETRFEITSGVALAHLDTLQLQIAIAGDVNPGVTLLLVTTSGPVTILTPTTSSLLSENTVTVPGFGDQLLDVNGYQWNLSQYAGTITSVTVDWSVSSHSISYGNQLAQASQQAVPEPGSTLLMAFGGSVAMMRFRSRTRRLSRSAPATA